MKSVSELETTGGPEGSGADKREGNFALTPLAFYAPIILFIVVFVALELSNTMSPLISALLSLAIGVIYSYILPVLMAREWAQTFDVDVGNVKEKAIIVFVLINVASFYMGGFEETPNLENPGLVAILFIAQLGLSIWYFSSFWFFTGNDGPDKARSDFGSRFKVFIMMAFLIFCYWHIKHKFWRYKEEMEAA